MVENKQLEKDRNKLEKLDNHLKNNFCMINNNFKIKELSPLKSKANSPEFYLKK